MCSLLVPPPNKVFGIIWLNCWPFYYPSNRRTARVSQPVRLCRSDVERLPRSQQLLYGVQCYYDQNYENPRELERSVMVTAPYLTHSRFLLPVIKHTSLTRHVNSKEVHQLLKAH